MESAHALLVQANLGVEALFLLLMAPVFLGCIAWEAWYWRRRHAAVYDWRDTLNNTLLALSHQIADALAWSLLLGLFFMLYRARLFEIPLTWWSVLLLWLAQDFLYYWFHRASHRIRWLWASHVVHQRLGLLEKLFNTPSHHRVHHAHNSAYIDRNYAGVLIVWDKLFGTFTEEDPACPPEYGIRRQVHTRSVFTMMFHEWRDMLRAALQPGPLWLRLKHLWAPPEWERPRLPEAVGEVRHGEH